MSTLANIGMALGLGATVLAGSVAGVTVNNNKQLENDNKQLVVEVETAKEENILQESIVSNLTAEKETLEAEINTIVAEKEVLNMQLATEQEKYNTLVAEKTELTNIYNALVESNNLTLEQKTELETQISEKQNQIERLQEDMTDLERSIVSRSNDIDTLKNRLNDISMKLGVISVTHDRHSEMFVLKPFSHSDPNKYFYSFWCTILSDGSSLDTSEYSGQELLDIFCSDDVSFMLNNQQCKSTDMYLIRTPSGEECSISNSVLIQFASEISINVQVTIEGVEITSDLVDPNLRYLVEYSVEARRDADGLVSEVSFNFNCKNS